MPLTPYHLHWSDTLIKRVELRLRQVHAGLEEFYRKNNYNFVIQTNTTTTATNGDNEQGNQQEDSSIHQRDGPINAVGSFLLRACTHSSPFYETQKERGVGADIAITLPEEICSRKEIQEGLYLERRHNFLLEVEKFLNSYNERMMKKTETVGKCDEDDDDEEENGENLKKSQILWEIQRIPFGNCCANAEKEILRISFIKLKNNTKNREVFYVDIHFQPINLPGRVASAISVRKHPLYSYLVQEDALMTVYLRKLHELYSQSHTLLRATVFLKCWAYHVGLMSRISGNPEGLNGFIISIIILRLVEEGIVTPNMSEENVVRAVWVRLSRGFASPDANINKKSTNNQKSVSDESAIKMNEEDESKEDDDINNNNTPGSAVLCLTGGTMNFLFRSSSAFFYHMVKPAADEALQFPRPGDVLTHLPFQPPQLRLDVSLVVEGLVEYFPPVDRSARVKTSGAGVSAVADSTQRLRAIVVEALGVRASYAAVWCHGGGSLVVAVRLTSEAEGRSRLTRGPALEETSAVARFDNFWGPSATSTRQFPDGGVYRCVLWDLDGDAGSYTTVAPPATALLRRVLQFALRRHASSEASVSVLLGGLEGVLAERVGVEWRDAAPLMQRGLMEACRDVESMITAIPRGVLPCKITALDIIAPSERHTATFPVRPHLALTYTTDDLTQPCFTGLSTAPTIEPIHGVLTIDDKNKIPDTIEAIATIKGAICAQLSKVLQQYYGDKPDNENKKNTTTNNKQEGRSNGNHLNRKQRQKLKNNIQKNDVDEEEVTNEVVKVSKFYVRTTCTSHSVDIIYKGYLFRMYIAHYREVSLLKALQRDAEASMIERKLFWSVQHAKFLRTIAFGHHSYATATRLALRWLSSMFLLEFVLPEAVELLVANAYLGQNPPKTPVSGFLRFVQLLATHDWTTPLVLPYSEDNKIQADAAALVRTMGEQQGMFIATPYAPLESPFTSHTPRPMIMHRVVQLAKGVVSVILAQLDGRISAAHAEASVFTSDPNAFDFNMVFHPHLILQPDRLITPPNNYSASVSSSEMDTVMNNTNIGNSGISPTLGSTPVNTLTTTTTTTTTNISPSLPPRVWQLDELEEEKSRLYVAELIEREPATHVVRSVRAATRDRCMIFYDCLAPRAIYIIAVTPTPVREFCIQLHKDILRVSRGALLPTTWPTLLHSNKKRIIERKPVANNNNNNAAARKTMKKSEDEKKEIMSRKRLRMTKDSNDKEVLQSSGSQQVKKSRRSEVLEESGKKKKEVTKSVSKTMKVK